MLKLIGMAVIAAGLILLGLVIATGRREGIKKDMEELSLITSAGYADTHKESKKGVRLTEDSLAAKGSVKAAPKKRTLSKEAKDILALVEKEKAEERKVTTKKRGSGSTAKVLGNKNPTATDVLVRPEDKKDAGTDILERKNPDGTDILERKRTDSTDVLKRETTKASEKTDVLKRERKKDQNENSTEPSDIATKQPAETENGTGILERRR